MRAAGVVLVTLCAAPNLARATPNFPPALQTDLMLSAQPACAICHLGGATGRGTVTTLFGESMLARGMVAYDEAALSSALMRLQQDHVDSDGDGVPDIDELRAGTDPNAPPGGGGESSLIVPQYGCQLAFGARADAPLAAIVCTIICGVACALTTYRRRQSREKSNFL
jgi:hypothetical protein